MQFPNGFPIRWVPLVCAINKWKMSDQQLSEMYNVSRNHIAVRIAELRKKYPDLIQSRRVNEDNDDV